ncbi:MAG TPA: DUF3426 domain-containing protein, partial [Myxococcota bacterium]|nr:DUF3426 domain-containing protein [Myxococcota bacterium]
VVMPRRIPPAPRRSPVATWAGWAGVAALVVATAWGSLRPATAPSAQAMPTPVSGFEVSEARARFVENAAAGPILVVSGKLRNPGPAARPLGAPLEVRLLDAAGAPLASGSAVAGPTLPEVRLREDAPDRLVAAQQAAASTLANAAVAAGAELGFSAVFAPAPQEARRFALAPGASAAR